LILKAFEDRPAYLSKAGLFIEGWTSNREPNRIMKISIMPWKHYRNHGLSLKQNVLVNESDWKSIF